MEVGRKTKTQTRRQNTYRMVKVPLIRQSFFFCRTGGIDQNINSFHSLDGCFHVYLDVGSNVGVQVRKLFEPSFYPGAPFVNVFDKEFGPVEARRKSVCAVGFEPNPHHTKRLAGNIE